MSANDLGFLAGDVVDVAQRLLGCELVRELNGRELVARIVETEAYHQLDAASHSYRGRTARTEVMFGPPGMAYVYFTYGMHFCFNVVCGPAGEGAGVLIRAAEPVAGIADMRHNRPNVRDDHLANGPAKLCQALAIDRRLNGHDLRTQPLRLRVRPPLEPSEITQTTRIGITRDIGRPWRFYIKQNAFVSRT